MGGLFQFQDPSVLFAPTLRLHSTPTDSVPWLPPSDCLSGHQIFGCLGRSLFGEVWKVQGPDGRILAVHRIANLGKLHWWARNELRFAGLLKSARHPALVPVESVKKVRGSVLIFTECAEETLWERFEQCRSEGKPGIPRHELIGYCRDAAEALDHLNREYAIQHLALNPSCLWCQQGSLRVADYGLAQFLWAASGQPLAELNLHYAAPELRGSQINATCDQYSLARIYQHMLTGELSPPPDLGRLPPEDRETIRRALEHDPRRRFASCTELVNALEGADRHLLTRLPPASVDKPTRAAAPPPGFWDSGMVAPIEWPPLATGHNHPPDPEQLIVDLVHQAMSDARVRECDGMRCLVLEDGSLQHTCAAWMTAEVAPQKLEGFIQRWHPEVLQADGDSYLFRVRSEPSLWQRLVGRQPAVDIKIHFAWPASHLSKLTTITVQMFNRGSKRRNRQSALEQLGSALLKSLRSYLLASPEQRIHERFPFAYPVGIAPLYVSGGKGDAVRAMGNDISLSGISFFLPDKPPMPEVCIDFKIYLTSLEVATVSIPAQVQRVQAIADGQFLVGTQFHLGAPANRSKLLLIADNARDTRWIDGLLQGTAGASFQLDRAASFTQGLERFADGGGGADLVLLDMSLPELRHLQALRKIRGVAAGIPIVVLAEHADDTLFLNEISEDFDACLVKNALDSNRLAQVLCGALKSRCASRADVLKREREYLLDKLEKNRQRERYLAYHDPLTGLPNRQQFYDRLQQALAQQAQMVAVLFIDLDGFKPINDTFGHATGDLLLQAVAQRLRSGVRQSDTVARLGGDEFTVCVGDIQPADVAKVARALLNELSRPFLLDNRELCVSASIGISVYPADATDLETLVHKADTAMYYAKRQGTGRFQRYQPTMEPQLGASEIANGDDSISIAGA